MTRKSLPPYSRGFGLARFVASVALDRARLDEFLAGPERAAHTAGLSEAAIRKLIQEDVLEVFRHMDTQYVAVLDHGRAAPDEQLGEGEGR